MPATVARMSSMMSTVLPTPAPPNMPALPRVLLQLRPGVTIRYLTHSRADARVASRARRAQTTRQRDALPSAALGWHVQE